MRTLINLQYTDLNNKEFADFYQQLSDVTISKNDNLTIMYNPFNDEKVDEFKNLSKQFSEKKELVSNDIKFIKQHLEKKLNANKINFSDIIITNDIITDVCERNLIEFYVDLPESDITENKLKSIKIYQRTFEDELYQVIIENNNPATTPKILKENLHKKKYTKYEPKKGERAHLANFSISEVERYKRLEKLVGISLLEVIEYKNKDYLDDVAIDWEGVEFTYAEIINSVDKIANSLAKLGIKENEIVGISSANTPTAIFAILACHRLGAIPSLYHPYSSKEQFKSFLDLEKPKVMIILEVEKLWNSLKDLIDESSIEKVIVIPVSYGGPIKLKIGAKLLQSKAVSIYSSIKDFKKSKLSKKDKFSNLKSRIIKPSFKTEIKKHSSVSKWSDIYDENTTYEKKFNETAVIVHTSGSQGTPKSVVLTHDQLNLNQAGIEAFMDDFKRGDILLGIPQIFHILGLNACVLLALRLGFKLKLVSSYKEDKFHLYFNKDKISFLLIVPTIAKGMLANKEKYNADAFSELTYMYMGGETINPMLYEEIGNFMHEKSNNNQHLTIGNALGATETGCLVSATAIGENDYKTAGKCIINSDVKVIDTDTNKILGTNEVGEIYFTSPSLMTGYYKNEQLTNKTIKYTDGVKWLTLGDLGFVDETGKINLIGRKDNAFKVDGVKVEEEKIKEVLYQIPGIEEIVLFKATNHELKDSVGALIVLKEDYRSRQSEVESLIYKSCASLNSKQRVRYVQFVDALSQNMGLKIDVKTIRKDYSSKLLTFKK